MCLRKPCKEGVLTFKVIKKVFTLCLGVLHVMCVAWCMDEPLVVP